MRAYLIAAATLTIACGVAFGQAYRWVDDQGRVNYTQTPPPAGAKDVQRRNLRQSGAPAMADLPYATQVAAKNFPVKLYTQPECGPPCDGARAALVKRAVPFTEISVVSQKELDEVKGVAGNATMPLLVVGSLHQSGYREDLVNSLLDTAGYPTSVSPLPLEALRKPAPAAPSDPESK
jgi:glutaredoxin